MLENFETQVNIEKDGYNIQTSIGTFKAFYQRIGWGLVGRAPTLFDKVVCTNAPIRELPQINSLELHLSLQYDKKRLF